MVRNVVLCRITSEDFRGHIVVSSLKFSEKPKNKEKKVVIECTYSMSKWRCDLSLCYHKVFY